MTDQGSHARREQGPVGRLARDGQPAEYNPTIRELPAGERPRERLEHQGAAALSTAELMAIILRTGTVEENVVRLAQRLLQEFGGLAGLAQAPISDLTRCDWRGPGQGHRAARRL